MALIPWRPFSEFDRFFEDEDWFLPVVRRTDIMEPAMDLYETENEVVAEMSLPDIDPAKVDIAVQDNMLRVSGASEEKKEEKKKDYYRKEIRKGSFERIARLPATVNENAVKATYEKGMLKIVMPKKAEAKSQAKKIKVTEKK